MGIRDRPTAPRSPWQNGHAERLIGSIGREYLSCDRVRRASSASRAALLRALLERCPNTPVAGQRLAPPPSRPDDRQHSSSADPLRTISPLRPDLICDTDTSALQSHVFCSTHHRQSPQHDESCMPDSTRAGCCAAATHAGNARAGASFKLRYRV
jgi:hypothetical protein